jgi:hypothetical protein
MVWAGHDLSRSGHSPEKFPEFLKTSKERKENQIIIDFV